MIRSPQRVGWIKTKTNRAGGTLGGISTGAPIICRIAVKPTPSVGGRQTSVDLETLQEVDLSVSGRHRSMHFAEDSASR